MRPITDAEERRIRQECRQQYRETGELRNRRYQSGAIESLVWEAETIKITMENDCAYA